MGSFSEDEEYRFFDAQEEVASISDDCTDATDDNIGCYTYGMDYDLWLRSPMSVRERRSQFMKWMGLDFDQIPPEIEEDFCSIVSSMSYQSSLNFLDEFGSMEEELECEDGILDMRVSYDFKEVVSDELVVAGETQECEKKSHLRGESKMNKKGWFKKLRLRRGRDGRQGDGKGKQEGSGSFRRCRIQKVKVRHSRRQKKELSALYEGQDIQAHEGSILAMKFSPDGQYLASAGEDMIVRVWQVVEDERCNETDIPDIDSSCIYFTVNNLSELRPLFVDKEHMTRVKSLKKTADSACVIFPPKVFRLLEKPLHEFHGHCGEILDLSWSDNNVSKYHKFSCSMN